MTNNSENKRFSTKSNVRRAARADGLELDRIEIMQDGAQFYYVRLPEPTEIEGVKLAGDRIDWGQGGALPADPIEDGKTDVAGLDEGDRQPSEEIEGLDDGVLITNGTSSERVLMLMDSEGGEYGRVTEADAETMARMLADSEKRMIQVVDAATLEPIVMVEYHAEATEAEGPDAVIEDEGAEVTAEPTVEPTDAVCGAKLVVRIAGSMTEIRDMAEKIAKLTRGTVEIVDAGTGEVQGEIVHKAVRVVAVKPTGEKAAKKDLPTGKMGLVAEMCMREEGATRAEMLAATGWAMMAGDTVKKLAEKYGLTYAKSEDGRGKRYFLYREEAEQIAA